MSKRLARAVSQLPPETLHQLVHHRGLDACGELIASATPAQLTSLLDLDLWRPARPGRDAQFDVDRFGEWIEMLVDTGETVAARAVAALDPNLVVAGLSRFVRVFDPGIFEPTAQSDDERAERHEAMREGDAIDADSHGGHLECEIGGYVLRARRADTWDAIVMLLVALEGEHSHCFHDLMQGCRRLSNSRPEKDGFHDLLQAPDQHLHDVAIEREHRRSQEGYATPADARAFLQMARQRQESSNDNPIVAAYFRDADEAASSASSTPGSMAFSLTAADLDFGEADAIEGVIELLTDAGVTPERPRALLEASDSDPNAATHAHLRRLMAFVRDANETLYLARSRELAFLANVLVAGCSVQSRPFTPREASDAARSTCNLGLEWSQAPDSFLIDHDLIAAFETGWSILHHEVSLFAAEQLIATLTDLHSVDRDLGIGLLALKRTLVTELNAGRPWRARDAAEILSMIDATAYVSVLGLLDECPVLPAALTAILEGRIAAVSPTMFDFISTGAQIEDARSFMNKLPDLLSR
jgi:hypothetical protein